MSHNDIRQARLDKLARLEALGINPYPSDFKVTAQARDLHKTYESLAPGAVTAAFVKVAGRVRSSRNSGRFIDLHDTTGKIQIFNHPGHLDQRQMDILGCVDVGDIIGIEGQVRRTPRGELTVDANQVHMLSKSLSPLPDKFNGLGDIETRSRQRHLDLIMNDGTRNVFRARSTMLRAIRDELHTRGFMEVETPLLQPIPNGGDALPFVTHHNALDSDLYLRIAPELYLKRLLVGGLNDKVFEIGRNFRNEGVSPRHNPEFTMLEAYQMYSNYQDMMTLFEDLVSTASVAVNGTNKVKYGETEIDFTPPFRRASMCSLVHEATGVDFQALNTAAEARAAAAQLGCEIKGHESWGKAVEIVFGDKVEKNLIQPTHVIDMPKEISPFAKDHATDSRLSERFETYCMGRELGNAYSEVNDPQDQLRRFEEQMAQRTGGNAEAARLDIDYVRALEQGLPPTGGMGLGIDRLAMFMTNTHHIREVLLFPAMRNEHQPASRKPSTPFQPG